MITPPELLIPKDHFIKCPYCGNLLMYDKYPFSILVHIRNMHGKELFVKTKQSIKNYIEQLKLEDLENE